MARKVRKEVTDTLPIITNVGPLTSTGGLSLKWVTEMYMYSESGACSVGS